MHIRPRSRSRGSACDRLQQCQRCFWFDTALGGIVGDAHLHAHVQGRQIGRTLRGQPFGYRAGGPRCAPRRTGRATARVLLACSRPMKCHSCCAAMQRLDLGQGFVHVVFAELA